MDRADVLRFRIHVLGITFSFYAEITHIFYLHENMGVLGVVGQAIVFTSHSSVCFT